MPTMPPEEPSLGPVFDLCPAEHASAPAASTSAARPRVREGDKIEEVKRKVHSKAVDMIAADRVGQMSEAELRPEIRRVVEGLVETHGLLISGPDRRVLVQELIDEIVGFGPLEPLLRDPGINDILVNGPDQVFVERAGVLSEVPVRFRDDEHLREIVRRIAAKVGRRVDESSPIVDARLHDGSRVNAILPPLAVTGTSLSIRRFGNRPLAMTDLIAHRALTPEMAKVLEAAVKARRNIVVSGGTGSGKTTLLNALSASIPATDRVITVEDTAELQFRHRHVVSLEARSANVEGLGEVTMRDLVRATLRMRPDRIIVGECRGAEVLDMLQALNTGHAGSMTTVHSNGPRDTLARLELMILLSGLDLPLLALRSLIGSAVELIVHVERLAGGVRRVTSVTEVLGVSDGVITAEELYRYRSLGVDGRGRVTGQFEAMGNRPRFVDAAKAVGIDLPGELFVWTPVRA
jgi:pilus assembly protein CpaF